MEPLKKLQYATNKYETVRNRISLIISKIQNSQHISSELEMDANGAMKDIQELRSIAEELEWLTKVAYYDRSVCQGLSDDQLSAIDGFVTRNSQQFTKLEGELTKEIEIKRKELRRKQQSDRDVIAARNTSEQILKDQQMNMDDWRSKVGEGVKDMKNHMLEIADNLEKGDILTSELASKVKDNKEENKKALTTVDAARKAMKKNKDCIFFFVTLLVTVLLILTFIFG